MSYTPGTGGSGLPASDRGTAFLGGFGVDISGPVSVSHTLPYSVAFDEVYTLDNGDTGPVDNAYMTWDPADGPHVTVKQAGWYCVGLELTWNEPLTAAVHWAIISASSQIGPTGSGLQDTMCAGAAELDDSLLCWISPDQIIDLELDATALAADATLNYALLTFTPLFTLA